MAVDKPQFWLKYNNGAESLQLPVNPEALSVSTAHGFQDFIIAGGGEFTIIGDRQQKEFSLSSFFPRDYNASYCEYRDLKDPYYCAAMIERWQQSGSPARFIVTGSANINIPVTIREFDYEERGGEPGDLYYKLTLKEYRFKTVAKKSDGNTNVNNTKLASTARPNTRVIPTSYTVKSGDSLFKISASVYGKGDDWRRIYDANKKVIGANPNAIKPGQKLVIPQ